MAPASEPPNLPVPVQHDTEPCAVWQRWVGRLALRLAGWKVDGAMPAGQKFILIAAPHTSNWDMPALLAATWSVGVRVRFLMKHSVFRFPFGGIMRALGGIPVDRRAPGGLVADLAKRIRDTDRVTIAIPPSGTRKKKEYWKSGFYHIAHAANIPIVLCYADYRTKTAGIGPPIHLTGDAASDMDRIRPYYEGRSGRFPELYSRIRLREEDAADEGQRPSATEE